MLLSVLAVSPYTGLQSGTVPATVAHLVMSQCLMSLWARAVPYLSLDALPATQQSKAKS